MDMVKLYKGGALKKRNNAAIMAHHFPGWSRKREAHLFLCDQFDVMVPQEVRGAQSQLLRCAL